MKNTRDAAMDALQKAQAALAERNRLVAFGADLAAQIATAVQAEADGTAARAHADAKSVLDDPSAKAGWLKQAAEAAKRVDAARQEQQRLRGAQGHLPAMLQAADDKIMPAHEMLCEAIELFRKAARQDFQVQLLELAKHAAEVSKCGFALHNGGIHLRHTLDSIRVPSAVSEVFLVSGAWAHPHGSPPGVKLDEIWRDDSRANELFMDQRQFTNGLMQFAEDVARIKLCREQQRNAETAVPQKTGMTIERVSQPGVSVQGPNFQGNSSVAKPQGPDFRRQYPVGPAGSTVGGVGFTAPEPYGDAGSVEPSSDE